MVPPTADMRDFAIHVAAWFDYRSREMDSIYLRLALFLDARFKGCVKSVANYYGSLQDMVRAPLAQACG
jgi:hypothetical protein